MSTRTVEQIDSWNTVAFSGGHSGLHGLADSEFSGAVIAGPTRLFMLNGNVVGILDGSIEDFEGTSATAREAPHPGLPLLAVMQERSEEVRAKYYTEDTPISNVDQTLSSGGFTGYVELSENVLSGDYYLIYHQGRSMSVAWVGNNDQLLTEDEAFEAADDEVGIYEVRPVDIEIVDIPEPDDDSPSGVDDEPATQGSPAATEDSDTDASDDHGSATAGDDERDTDTSARARDTESTGQSPEVTDPDPVAKTATESTVDRSAESERSGAERSQSSQTGENRRTTDDSQTSDPESNRTAGTTDERTSDAASTGRDTGHRTPEQDGQRQSEAASTRSQSTEQPTDSGQRRDQERPAETTDTRSTREPTTDRTADSERSGAATPSEGVREAEPSREATDAGDVAAAPHDPSAGGAADLETRSIPSLDPSHSETASKTTATAGADQVDARSQGASQRDRSAAQSTGQSQQEQTEAQRRSRTESSHAAEPDQPRQDTAGQQPQQDHPGAPPDREPEPDPEPASAERQERSSAGQGQSAASTERIEELESELEATESERDQLQSELDSLADERDELQRELDEAQTEIEELEARLNEMAAEDDDTPDADTRLSQQEAIEQTNLFVRYNSKGDATLEAVHSGNANRSDVDDNLRLEFHTQFDAESAAVGNQAFETFLSESIQYRFVDWLVSNLLYEIRDTGNPEAMKELYNALPKIDRAELNGMVSVEYMEDGEQHRSQEEFDVVVRDRMGNPLIVANINDSRDPATDHMMTDLITRAERVGSSSESLAGAFLVTESFFEPPALETAEEATSSGLLSRDKRKSFVNLTRKDGYHLCLVEARNQEFHLAVPEL